MVKYLKIGEILIELTYCYDDYFQDKIDAYEVEPNQHSRKMIVEVKDRIDKPNRAVTYTFKNRYIYDGESDFYVVTMTGEDVKHIIYYRKDYHEIRITLNSNIGKRLAEHEYVLTGMLFFEMALDQNYLPIHGSALTYRNQCLILSGPSKSGKSTQTRLFCETYPKTMVINEDKPLIYIKDGQAYVVGSPWSGKHVINENISRKLNEIFFIEQSDKLDIIELTKKQKIKSIFRNIHRPGEESLVDKMMLLVEEIIDKTSIYQFNTVLSQESSKFLYQFLEEKNEN